MKTTKDKKIKELEQMIRGLRCDNLRMRLNMEILINHPQGNAARIIRDRYREKLEKRLEEEQQ